MYTYRASELGGCIKRLVAQRLGYKPVDAPPPAIQAAFDRGNAHEDACLATAEAQGWGVRSQQKELVIPITPEIQVVGHLDAEVVPPGEMKWYEWYVGEAKSPNAWQLFIDHMYDETPPPLIDRYKWQLSCYMVAEQREALLLCLDSQYQLRYHGVELPFYDKEQIIERVLEIERQAAEGLPRFCNVREYPCPFFPLHEEEVADEEDPFDAELHDAALNYKEAERLAKKSKATLDRLMEPREHYWHNDVRITRYSASRRTVDYKKACADYGVELGPYTRQVDYESIRTTVAGSKEEHDGEG